MNNILCNILNNRITLPDWLTYVGGLAYAKELVQETENESTITKRIPVTEFLTTGDDCTGKTKVLYQLIPDSSRKGLMYWEELSAISVTGVKAYATSYSSRLRTVVWLNHNLLFGAFVPANTVLLLNLLAQEIRRQIPFNEAPFARVHPKLRGVAQRSSAIFSAYDYIEKDSQYLLPPFDYFAMDWEVTFDVPFVCIDSPELITEAPACNI